MVAAAGTGFVYRTFMRCLAFTVVALLLTGCASRTTTSPRMAELPEAELASYAYASNSAAALAFAPPVVANAVTPNLSRDGRETTAFVGFDSVITTHFYLRTDDRQIIYGEDSGRYERRAISERFGVSYR